MKVFIFLFFSFIFLSLSEKLSKLLNFYDIPDGFKIHKNKIPNAGGLALIPLVITMLLVFDYDQKITFSLNLFLIVIIIGVIDDFKNIKPQLKLIALLVPIYIFTKDVSIVKSLGVYGDKNFALGPLSFVFTLLSIFLLTNAYNYIDGLDGLLVINLIITFLTFLFFNKFEINLLIPFILFLSVYFLYNINFLKLFPKQFLGNSGSLSFGFLVSILIIIFTQSQKIVHPSIIIWAVAFVVYEFLSINIIRIKKKKNIFKRDLNFIFNLFAKKYNSKISLMLCTIIHILLSSIGVIMNLYKSYSVSLSLFILLFFCYLYFRMKQMQSND